MNRIVGIALVIAAFAALSNSFPEARHGFPETAVHVLMRYKRQAKQSGEVKDMPLGHISGSAPDAENVDGSKRVPFVTDDEDLAGSGGGRNSRGSGDLYEKEAPDTEIVRGSKRVPFDSDDEDFVGSGSGSGSGSESGSGSGSGNGPRGSGDFSGDLYHQESRNVPQGSGDGVNYKPPAAVIGIPNGDGKDEQGSGRGDGRD